MWVFVRRRKDKENDECDGNTETGDVKSVYILIPNGCTLRA